MNKYITCLDVETTGLSQKEDYIIQLSMIKLDRTLSEIDRRNWYINPIHQYTIKPDALNTHHITKEFLNTNGVPLKDIAQEIIDFVQDSDYLTYNGNTFDIRFLYKDLNLIGYEFPMKDKVFYDAFALYKLYNPCTLSAVYKRYTGRELMGAHDSLEDVKATIEVFKHICEEQGKSHTELSELKECQLLSPEGSIRNAANMNEDGQYIVFNQGKYKDAEFLEVYQKDPAYVQWFGQNVASSYTKKILNEYVKEKLKK